MNYLERPPKILEFLRKENQMFQQSFKIFSFFSSLALLWAKLRSLSTTKKSSSMESTKFKVFSMTTKNKLIQLSLESITCRVNRAFSSKRTTILMIFCLRCKVSKQNSRLTKWNYLQHSKADLRFKNYNF